MPRSGCQRCGEVDCLMPRLGYQRCGESYCRMPSSGCQRCGEVEEEAGSVHKEDCKTRQDRTREAESDENNWFYAQSTSQ
ncbi:hypothetical protein FKM82_022646 [Ascaphus truei]